MKKELMLILDTETAGPVEDPIPYDIGYVICDKAGNIELTRSFVVAEMFLEHKDLMQTAYYANKIPQYWDDITEGKRLLKKFYNIRTQMLEDIKTYNIKRIGAYNAYFDMKALNNLARFITNSRLKYFFPYGLVDYFCIWSMACTSILNRPSYIKFAQDNGLVSASGNIQTSAECAYRYITKNTEFVECHTGLEDVLIEVAIMVYCYRQHKHFENKPNKNCWMIVQKKRREITKNA